MPCKKMRTKYNYTPNDYELSFDHTLIPSNIDVHNVGELTVQLQSRTPLGKVIHVILDEKNEDVANTVELYNEVSLSFENKTKELRLR
jgi:hypothetical protein